MEKDYQGTDQLIPYSDQSLTTKNSTYQAPTVIALGANYTMGDLAFLFRFDTSIGQKTVQKNTAGDTTVFESTAGTVLNFTIQPKYTLGDLGSIFADISLGIVGNSENKLGSASAEEQKNGTVKLGLGIAFDKNIGSGGNFKIGVAATLTRTPPAASLAIKRNPQPRRLRFRLCSPTVCRRGLYAASLTGRCV